MSKRNIRSSTKYKQEGNLRLARNTAEDKIIQNLVKEQKNGLEIEYLKNTNEISEICPSISENVISASYCPTDGHADPIDTLRAYKEAAQKNGVIFTNNEEVLEISEKGSKIGMLEHQRKIFPKFCVLTNGILQ